MSFSVYVGDLTWGTWGGAAQSAPVLIPVHEGESYCDHTKRKMLLNGNNGSGGGNFACDGCKASKKGNEWDIVEITTQSSGGYSSDDGLEGSLVIWWDESEKWYKVEDTDGNALGWCSWNEPTEDDNEKCVEGLDVFYMVSYMKCDLDYDLTWDD